MKDVVSRRFRLTHSTESVYRRYATVSESDLREAVEKLGAISGLAAS